MKFSYRTRFCVLAGVMMLGASEAGADVAVQYHCAGGSELAHDSHLPTLQKVIALGTTANFENVALSRLSRLVIGSLRLGNHPSSVSLLQPLLSDIVEKESLGRFGSASADAPGFILALRVGAPRAQLWQDKFAKLFGGSGEIFARPGFTGRRWNAGGSNSSWIIPAQDWLLAGCGDDFSAVQLEYLNRIKSQGRPAPVLEHNWLEVDLDSDRLGGWFPLLKSAHIRLTVTPREDALDINARALEAQAISWKSDPWQIPKDLMRGQIISFTAGRNVAAFLNMDPALSQLAGNPLTNQFYAWSLDQVPLLNYMAWPEANASNDLQKLSTEAPTALSPTLKRFNGTELLWNPKAAKLTWMNMRMLVPVLEAANDKNGQFLFLSSSPRLSQGKPAPEELLGQIQGRTNLVYYDWELTGRRLSEWEILSGMVANRSSGTNDESFAATDAAMQWIGGVAGLVGNTVTEITRGSPNELSAEREAPLGFTAMELMLLANWLCDANSGPIHSPAPAGNAAPFPIHR
jgi:hypothetical protein